MDVDFLTVRQSIPIGVTNKRTGAKKIQLIRIGQPVGVQVLVAIRDSIPVGVGLERVCVQDIQLHAIAEPVFIRVDQLRIGLVYVNFIPVGEPIPIRIQRLVQFVKG